MKSIYQLTALIGNKSDGINDEKFMTAAWILYAWMRREVIDCIPLPELPATVSKSAKTGRSVASIYQPEEHFFKVDPGLSECGFGGASDILEQGDEYYITYGGKRRLLERHLKKGVNHNALYCLRIYFFWDEKSSHVVIGSLPGHLRSSLT